MANNVYDTLIERGFLYQATDEEAIRDLLNKTPVTFYVGFDPSAVSLHVGNLVPTMAMVHLQRAGHVPIAIVGGATGMVGDPSGKTEARQMASLEALRSNTEGLKAQLGRYLEFGEGKAKLLNNLDWLGRLNYLEFLRDYGSHFSVNRMLTAESVKTRLETGLSFLEFNYMLLQAFDFYRLAHDYGCSLQMGGQDQWGNIVMGIDLCRRLLGKTTYGMTFPLITNASGEKFGKSVAGAVWIDAELTSTYHYYQFWRNVDDRDVARFLKLFTLLPVEECDALATSNINRAKEILAFEATRITHGSSAAVSAYQDAGREFGFADPEGQVSTSSALREIDERLRASGGFESKESGAPTSPLLSDDLTPGVRLTSLFHQSGLSKSAGEARRLIQQGGAYLNEERMNDVERMVTPDDVRNGGILLRAGKKRLHRFIIDS